MSSPWGLAFDEPERSLPIGQPFGAKEQGIGAALAGEPVREVVQVRHARHLDTSLE